MNAIFRWSLWQRRMSTLWWSIGVSAFTTLNMVFYPSFKDQAAELQKSFDNLPDTAVQLFGGSTDFFSPVGFLNSQIFFIMLPLLLGILAINLGSGLLAREEQDHTIESLLARPIKRSQLLLGKALSGAVQIAAVAAVNLLVTLIIAHLVELTVPTKNIVVTSLVCYLLALSFGSIAFAISAFGKARVASFGVAAAIAFGGYVVSSLAGTVDWLKAPSKIFSFHYYKSEAMLQGQFYWSDVIFLAAVIIGGVVLAILAFRNRDLG